MTTQPGPVAAPAVPAAPVKRSLKQQLALAFSLKQWPTKYTVIASLVCGAVTVLNQTTLPHALGYGGMVQTAITFVLGGFAFLKIGPTLGPKFKAALHLPPSVAEGISVALLVGMTVAQVDTGLPWRAVIIGVIQVAGGLGFAPAYIPTA